MRTSKLSRPRQVMPVLMMLLASLSLGLAACGGTAWQDPRQITENEHQVVAASNDFGLDFFREVVAQSDGGNVFVSPLSVSMALGMTLNGARGSTEQGMLAALRLEGLDRQQINQSYLDLIELLTTMDPQVTLEIANSIWYRQGLEVLQEFIDTNVTFFGAVVQALDFSDGGAADIINAWVAEKTHDLITEIVEKPIDPMLVMFLINAVYFKGDWSSQFDKSDTHADTFHAPQGDETVQMMVQKSDFRIVETTDLSAIELPYGHGLFRMTILLPHADVNVDDVVASLTPEQWEQLQAQFAGAGEREFTVYLPRFELKWETVLNDVLSALGMAEAFDPNRADFSGIVAAGGLFISRVRHKTYVRVDEEGTEAAAVTSVEVGATSAQPDIFRVDRPFVFVIHDNHSGALLFAGKIVSPPSF